MTANNDESLAPRVIFGRIRQLALYILYRWKSILVFGFVGGIAGLLIAQFTKPKYEATTSFFLSSENSRSGLLGLASQFGVDLGGNGSDAFSGENIIALCKSRLLLKRALFQRIPGTEVNLINRFCKSKELDKSWAKKQRTATAYPFPDSFSSLNAVQDSLVNEVYLDIIKTHLDVAKPDRRNSYYEVTCISGDELFSSVLTTSLVNVTTDFYIETKTKLARQNLAMLQKEADSLKSLLHGRITATATAVDKAFNLNPGYQIQRSPVQQGQASVTVLSTAYGEVVKNLEIAKINLQKETPLFQIIDQPSHILKKQKPGRLMSALLGAIISSIICVIGILFKRSISA